MTPLKRLEVSGPGALDLLQQLTTNQLAKTPGFGHLRADARPRGGIRSDVTVARLSRDSFQVGVNGNLDTRLGHPPPARGRHGPGPRHHRRHLLHRLVGPARAGRAATVDRQDFSAKAMRYFTGRQTYLGNVPVTALRLSYVGELGWELYTTAEMGRALWDLLWEAGQPYGVIAAGRSAFNSMRLEKGYRSWGTDMTTEHDPYEAGLGFAVRKDKGPFIGSDAIADKSSDTATRLLSCLTIGSTRTAAGFRGHLAVARALHAAGGWRRVVGGAIAVPPLSWAAALGYRVVVRYRHRLPGTTSSRSTLRRLLPLCAPGREVTPEPAKPQCMAWWIEQRSDAIVRERWVPQPEMEQILPAGRRWTTPGPPRCH